MNRGSAVLRRRIAFAGWLPSWDHTGLWPQVTWLCWAWDLMPGPIGVRVGRLVDDMRMAPQPRRTGTPGDRLHDDPVRDPVATRGWR